jgi:polysaccharide biosynthesis/export protein
MTMRSICFFTLAVCAGFILSTGCVSSSQDLGASVEFDDAIDEGLLRMGILFSVSVEVGDEVEFESKNLWIDEGGNVVLPIIRDVALEGLTLEDASDLLTSLYQPYYVDKPVVRVQFSRESEGAPWGYVTVLGRVRKPGRVNLPPTRDMTVSMAVQGADGFDTSANLKAIRIIRTNKDKTKSKQTVNIKHLGRDGETKQDVRLRAGDVVFVPERIF